MPETPVTQRLPGLKLTPEFELLLHCSRPTPNSSDLARQRQLAKAIHPDTLIRLAKRHKLAPLVYCNLRQHPPGIFSPGLLDALAKLHAENKRKAMASLLTAHQLAASGIPVCTLKGLDVAVRAYGDMAARHVGDIDLLVNEANLPQASAYLIQQGWLANEPELLSGNSSRLLRRFKPDCSFQRPGFPLLELHWRAFANPHECHTGLLRHGPISVTPSNDNALDRESLLIYLCLHGSKHGWMRLKWLFDLPNVIERLSPDWPSLWQRARELHAEKAIQQGLMLAAWLCNLTLPAAALAGFRYRFSSRHWQYIGCCLQLSEHQLCYPGVGQILRHARYRLSMQTSLRNTVWQAGGLLYPDYRDYRILPLPTALSWLYLPLRPLLWLYRKRQRS